MIFGIDWQWVAGVAIFLAFVAISVIVQQLERKRGHEDEERLRRAGKRFARFMHYMQYLNPGWLLTPIVWAYRKTRSHDDHDDHKPKHERTWLKAMGWLVGTILIVGSTVWLTLYYAASPKEPAAGQPDAPTNSGGFEFRIPENVWNWITEYWLLILAIVFLAYAFRTIFSHKKSGGHGDEGGSKEKHGSSGHGDHGHGLSWQNAAAILGSLYVLSMTVTSCNTSSVENKKLAVQEQAQQVDRAAKMEVESLRNCGFDQPCECKGREKTMRILQKGERVKVRMRGAFTYFTPGASACLKICNRSGECTTSRQKDIPFDGIAFVTNLCEPAMDLSCRHQ